MNTIVNKLLDVDKEARQAMDDARQYYEKTLEEIGQEKERMSRLYEEKAALHIQSVQSTESAALEESSNEMKARYSEMEQKLNDIYNENFERWVGELTHRCLGR